MTKHPDAKTVAAYQDWIGGMTYAQIADKHDFEDHVAAYRAVRTAREAFISDLNVSDRTSIKFDPARLAKDSK